MIREKTTAVLYDHLLAFHAAAYALGVWISSLYILPIVSTLTYLLLPVTFAAVLFLGIKKQWLTTAATSLLLFFTTGYYLGLIGSATPANDQHLYHLVSGTEDVVVTGYLKGMPSFDGTTTRAIISASTLQKKTESKLHRTHGTIVLRMRFPWPVELEPGAKVAIRATLHPPSHYNTPGSFDYPAYLARKGIWLTGYVRSPAQITELACSATLSETMSTFPERLRNRIGQLLDFHLPADISGLYRALLLGDRSRVAPETLEAFKMSGTMHILAISGIHMSLIALLLFALFYWLLRRSVWLILRINTRKAAGILCLPILLCYALLAGLNTPVLRACIMSCLVIFAYCTDRPKTVSPLIALAVLLLLTANPQSLYTVSFQLTFAAFSAIMMISPVVNKYLLKNAIKEPGLKKTIVTISRWAFSGLAVSSIAVLATAPILIYHFHRLPLLGPLTNLVIEPFICLWALPAGFFALPLLFLQPDLALLILQFGAVGLKIGLAAAYFFASLPHAAIWRPPPSDMLLLCYYATLFLSLLSFQHPPGKMFARVVAPSSFALCLTAVLLSPPSLVTSQKNRAMLIHFLDVGQGSATLVELANDRKILIDGGGSAFALDSVGQSVIAPFLWKNGIHKLDAIVITHADSDHSNGLPFILEHFTPDILWSSTELASEGNYGQLLNLARRNGVKIETPQKGDILFGQDTAGEAFLVCLKNFSNLHHPGTNNSGIVVALTVAGQTTAEQKFAPGKFQLIFPGDIEKALEHELIGQIPASARNFLLASHHGSAGSNSKSFLQHVAPALIVASAGRSRSAYFPAQELRDYCAAHQIPLLVTAEHGTIRVTIENGLPQVWIVKLSKNPLRRDHSWVKPQRIQFPHPRG